MAGWRLTQQGRHDLRTIIAASRRMFGPDQARRYAELFGRIADMAAAHPDRPGSRDCSPFAKGVRSLHFGIAAGRRAAASHVILYRRELGSDDRLSILRVLHERMDPALHLGAAEDEG